MNETTDASAIFAPIWRRKWLILLVGIVVAGLAYAYYKRQASEFQVTTQIYLGSGSEEQSLLANTQKKSLNERAIADQAAIVNSGVVTEAVHSQLRGEHAHAALKGKVHAKAVAGSDFILITAEAHNGKAAAKLANTYAAIYIKRARATYLRDVRAAIAVTHKELRRLESQAKATKTSGRKVSTSTTTSTSGAAALQTATLATRISQFESDLSVAGAVQTSPATPKKAQLLSPMPKKNAIFGFVLGILLASIAAYSVGRLDRRLRSLTAIEEAFNASTLAALPRVRRPIIHRGGQPTLSGPLLEPLRRAHTSVQLGNALERAAGAPPRLLLVLSADAGDGRSTLVSGLALVARDAGERVAVVEADLRRPVLAKLLDVSSPNGLAEVLAGGVAYGTAMQHVASSDAYDHDAAAESGGGGAATLVAARAGTGSASVLIAGAGASNPPALLASHATEDLLRSLADDFDSVLLDVPSPLEVSDAMPLLHLVDGIVIVARVGHTRQASAQRLVELLERSPSAPVLGVVANDVASGELNRLGFSPQNGERGLLGSLLRR
jgi:polysaccharide biosynthesis transport protein